MYKMRNSLVLERVRRTAITVLWRVKGLHTSGVAVMQARTCYTHLGGAGIWGSMSCPVPWAHTQCPYFLVSSHQIICGLLSDRSYKVFVYTPYVLQFLQELFRHTQHSTCTVRGMAAPWPRRLVADCCVRSLWLAGQSLWSCMICVAYQMLSELSKMGGASSTHAKYDKYVQV